GETEWQLILPAAALAYNTKVNMSTGVTPALAFLGHELAMPIDLALQQKRTAFPDVPSTVRSILNRYNRLYQLMAEKQEAVIRRNTRQYSGLVEFQVGETVWYMDHRPHTIKPAKIAQKWIGPFVIKEKYSAVLYKIAAVNGDPRTYTVHVGRLKKCLRVPNEPILPVPGQPPDDFHDNEEGEELFIYP
ncbi:MAG: hypothetical protein GY696_18140, partial [Gammaproteobacteria bacterium]|nr:hypothetical protein [Gammaproteobacteria bacterium]